MVCNRAYPSAGRPTGPRRARTALAAALLVALGLGLLAPPEARAQSLLEAIRKATSSLGMQPQEAPTQAPAGPAQNPLQALKSHLEELQNQNESEKDRIIKTIDGVEKEQSELASSMKAAKDEQKRNLLTDIAGTLAERRKVLRQLLRLLDNEVKSAKAGIQVLQESLAAQEVEKQPQEAPERELFSFTEAEVANKEVRLAEGKAELVKSRIDGLDQEQKAVSKEVENTKRQRQEAKDRLAALQKQPQAAAEEPSEKKLLDPEILQLDLRQASQNLALAEEQLRYLERRGHLLEVQRTLADQELKLANNLLEAKKARAEFIRARVVVTPQEADQVAKQVAQAEKELKWKVDALERERDRVDDEKLSLERQHDRQDARLQEAKTPEEKELAEGGLQVTKLKLALVDRQAARLAEEISLLEEQADFERQRVPIVRQKVEFFQGKLSKSDLRDSLEKVTNTRKNLQKALKAQEIKKELARQEASQAEAALKVSEEKRGLLKKTLDAKPKANGSQLLALADEELRVQQELAQVASKLQQVQTDRERLIQERIKTTDDWQRFLAERGGAEWSVLSELKASGKQISVWVTDFASYIKVLLVVILGLILAKFISLTMERTASERMGKHVGRVGGRVVYYIVLFLTLLVALSILNIKLATVLAAAGVLTIAIGFAAQTSLANVISGIMLLGDRPFQVDDFIEVEDKSGFVISIDLLSTKLRTLDNTLVRIPNETLIKSTVRNVTRFDIRRLDIEVGVTYSDNLELTHKVLQNVARQEVLVLEEPKPLVLARRFAESSIDFILRAWVPRKEYYLARSNLVKRVKQAFDAHGITIAFPHRTIYIAEVPELKTAAAGHEAPSEPSQAPPGPPRLPAKEEIDSQFHKGETADAPDMD